MRRRRYPSYRDSGVEWLGEIPEHWDVVALRRSVRRSDRKIEAENAGGMPYVGLEHVESWTGRLMPLDDQKTPESLSNAFTAGDVLFGKLRPYLAKAFCANFDGLCSTEFLVLKPLGYQQQYLLYLLLSDSFISQVDSSTYGARMPRANWDAISGARLPLPPLEEQRAIASYLDQETGKIDELVAKKRMLIERLGEYRMALITRTVTRGLPSEDARSAGPGSLAPSQTLGRGVARRDSRTLEGSTVGSDPVRFLRVVAAQSRTKWKMDCHVSATAICTRSINL